MSESSSLLDAWNAKQEAAIRWKTLEVVWQLTVQRASQEELHSFNKLMSHGDKIETIE